MTLIIDLTIQNLLENKYKIENSKNWISKSYWCKKSEIQKIDNEIHEIIRSNFTRVILPVKKFPDFTFDDVFQSYLEYYIFDDSYIPLGKYIQSYYHTETIDSTQITFINAIFTKDSVGSNIYTSNDTIICRPIYVKTVHLHAVMV